MQLLEKDIIDPRTGTHYAFIDSLKKTTGKHSHDFYELFLITSGSVIHNINCTRQHLETGSLVFIRPSDVHYYEKGRDEDCKLINLALSRSIIDPLFSYLGDFVATERLLNEHMPPSTMLSHSDRAMITSRLTKISNLTPLYIDYVMLDMKVMLVELFARFFCLNNQKNKYNMPDWLKLLTNEMSRKENFTVGLPALYKLSNKSTEYLCRTFKKYLDITPSEFVNDLRTNYAANQLMNSDNKIINISMDSGFDNLSHFYHQFKKKFGTSPAQYRKLNRKMVIPV